MGVAPPARPKGNDPPPKNGPVFAAPYGDQKTSGIAVSVAAGKNQFDFDLKSR